MGAVQLVIIAIVVMVVLIFATNTKRWRAIGHGVKKSKRELGEEIRALDEERKP